MKQIPESTCGTNCDLAYICPLK